jgi:hypothetical protein
LRTNDDLVKLINTFSSKNPDSKIAATTAMDSSQRKSLNIFSKGLQSFSNGNDLPALDLKFCMHYIFPKSMYSGIMDNGIMDNGIN